VRYTTRPLSGWDGPRTPAHQRRSRWAFRAGWQSTLDLLERELEHLDARDVVLEADFREQDLRLDGLPRSNAREPQDPGIRLAFGSKHGDLVYQCDSVDGWRENVRSIALGLEALRAVDRYGITRRAEQYTGWRQIGGGAAVVPDAPMTRERAAEVVLRAAGVTASDRTVAHDVDALLTGRLDLDVVARRAQRNAHPDTGGNAELFDQVQRAIAVLRGAR
jgi:hypothetical protein